MISFEKTPFRIASAFVLSLAVVWAIFVGAGQAHISNHPDFRRPVYLAGKLLGHVELRPLELKDGLWSLDVFFNPLDSELGCVREHKLRWWQIVDRNGWEGYPRMDLQRGSTLPGSPGDDDDPAYYTRKEKLGLGGYFTPEEIFTDNKYWLRDIPQPEDGVHFEAWLVHQGDHEFVRLVGFEWGLEAHGGFVWRVHHPQFVDASVYDVERILQRSGFGSRWRDLSSE